MTLVETMIAAAILGSVIVGIAGLVSQSIKQSKNMGSTMSQATALAAQKVDQLMTMQWCSGVSPAPGCPVLAAPLTAGGSILADIKNPSWANVATAANPADYVEYLDSAGVPVPGAVSSTDVGVFFTRRWQITDSTATTKLIEAVVVGTGIGSAAPSANMACIKAQQ